MEAMVTLTGGVRFECFNPYAKVSSAKKFPITGASFWDIARQCKTGTAISDHKFDGVGK
jgi:hypothetical protein